MLNIITAIRVEEGFRRAAAHIGADESFAQRTIAREEKDARDLGRILKLMAIAHMRGQNGR